DAQREIAADPLARIVLDSRLRLALDPAALHRQAPFAPAKRGRAQPLPSTRLLHQPERRGRSPLSSSVELDTTGSPARAGCGLKDGLSSCPSWPSAFRAGPRPG